MASDSNGKGTADQPDLNVKKQPICTIKKLKLPNVDVKKNYDYGEVMKCEK
jgi:hypothetical protein